MTVFDHISKHREESWKYDAQRSIFDKLRRLLECGQTSSWMFAISKTKEKTEERLLPVIKELTLALYCNPFSHRNWVLPSYCRFTVWNWLKFFNPDLINFIMIFPPRVRLGLELNSKLNVLTAKDKIHVPWLDTITQTVAFIRRKHWWGNDIKKSTSTVVKSGQCWQKSQFANLKYTADF